jgi:hypothetical protein
MDHVHIAIVLITMLKVVVLQDNFLTILMSIWTHNYLDRGMTLTLTPMTRDGAISLISRGKLKLLKIMLHNFMTYTIRHIRNSMIKWSIHHLTSILPTSNGNHLHIECTLRIIGSLLLRLHHLLSLILTFNLRYWNLWVRSKTYCRCVLVVRVKSILGVGPKVKESIKNPFK